VNPFTALGLPATPDLDDEQVRQAWRTVAAATHPDRGDGGDPAAYTAASAAYALLRTAWGRSEALADLADLAAADQSALRHGPPGAGPVPWRAVMLLPGRIRRGRLVRMAVRTLTAAAFAVTAVVVIPGTASEPAVVAGCALCWALTIRSDLAPRPDDDCHAGERQCLRRGLGLRDGRAPRQKPRRMPGWGRGRIIPLPSAGFA
jgi:hypothetical protein